MLENSLLDSQSRRKTRKPFTLVVSVLAHVITVGTLVIAPLASTQALPVPPVDVAVFLPRLDTPLPTRSPSVQPPSQSGARNPLVADAFAAPRSIPSLIATVDAPLNVDFPAPVELHGTGGAGVRTGVPFGFPGAEPPEVPPALPLPPPPPPPPKLDVKPIRQGGDAQAAKLIHQVLPVYPEIAKRTRTQGAVVLEAVISRSGTIESMRVISGHPLLRQAAIDAVKEWRYRPTLLNGEPVEVITTVTVTFNLSEFR